MPVNKIVFGLTPAFAVTAVKVLPEKTRAEKFPIKLNGCPLMVASNSVTAAAPAPYVAPGMNPVIPNVPVPIISEGDSSPAKRLPTSI